MQLAEPCLPVVDVPDSRGPPSRPPQSRWVVRASGSCFVCKRFEGRLANEWQGTARVDGMWRVACVHTLAMLAQNPDRGRRGAIVHLPICSHPSLMLQGSAHFPAVQSSPTPYLTCAVPGASDRPSGPQALLALLPPCKPNLSILYILAGLPFVDPPLPLLGSGQQAQ